MIRILVADDHTVVREGIKQILTGQDDMVVEDEAGNGQEVINSITKKTF
jgi:DNA-binding NarL/FixJ family response regulator